MSQINIKFVIIILIFLFVILYFINFDTEHFTITIDRNTFMSSVFRLRRRIDTIFDSQPEVKIIGSPTEPPRSSLLNTIKDLFGPVTTNAPIVITNYPTTKPTNYPTTKPDNYPTIRPTNEPENQYEFFGQIPNITSEPIIEQSSNNIISDDFGNLKYCSKNNMSTCQMQTILQNQYDDINLFNSNESSMPNPTISPQQYLVNCIPENEDILEYYKKNQVIVQSYLDDNLMLGSNVDEYVTVSSVTDHGSLRPEIKEFQYPKPNGYIFNNSSLKI